MTRRIETTGEYWRQMAWLCQEVYAGRPIPSSWLAALYCYVGFDYWATPEGRAFKERTGEVGRCPDCKRLQASERV